MSTVDRAVRWTRLAAVLAGAGRAAIGWGSLAVSDRDERIRTRAAAALRAVGVRLEAPSHRLSVPGPTGTLIVANHISWLDVLALLAIQPAAILAKKEIAGWPLLGPLASRADTLFIDRRRLRVLPTTVAALAARLRTGRPVLVFPQATSWCGRHDGPFRRAVFQAAIDAGAPVQPVTITYHQGGIPSTVGAFIGEDTLAASMARVIAARDLVVRVEAHPPIAATSDLDRRRLADLAQAAVRQTCTAGPAHA